VAIAVVTTGTSNTGALGFTATAGRLVICAIALRNWNVAWTPGNGFAVIDAAERKNNATNTGNILICGKVATGGETTIGGSWANNAGKSAVSLELTGATLTGATGSATNGTSGTTRTAPTQSPAGGSSCIILGAAMAASGSSNNTAVSPYTGVGGSTPPSGNTDWPRTLLEYLIEASASGTYTPTATGANAQWAAASVTLFEASAPALTRSQAVLI
jgi:hypothetical protein